MGKDATQALTAEFLSAVIHHVAHPIFVKDRQFRFVLVNPAFCEVVGYERDSLLGKTDYDFFPKEQADFFRQNDVEMFTSGSSVSIDEELITDSSGTMHVLATTKVPQRDAAGEVTHLVGIIHDVTMAKGAEEALRKANDELELRVQERTSELREAQQKLVQQERLSVLGHLAGGLAHQLRNPLGIIQNAVALLRKGKLQPLTTQAVDIIEEEVQRSDGIIRDLLDYARVVPPTCREVLLRDVVAETLEQAKVPPNIAVEVGELDEMAANLDPMQIQTALGNLVRNATEAMPEGGRLRLEAVVDSETIRLVVSDSGRGVAPERRSNLFDPLVTTKPMGSGLGLSTARLLVENHQGTISCDASSLGGAKFTIELPRRRATEP